MKNFRFRIQDNNYNVKIVSHENSQIELEVNGTAYSVTMKDEVKKSKTPTLVRSASKNPSVPLKMSSNSSKAKIVAPIPGVVMSIDIKIGDVIKVGDRLLVLEAMKMENNITSEKSGTVSAIHISKGQQVLQDELLIELA
jgi:biotin carboxyl carrier protein